jgi:urease accessory protein
LAFYVGASLEVMERDTKKMRQGKPFFFTNLKNGDGADEVVKFIINEGMLCNK